MFHGLLLPLSLNFRQLVQLLYMPRLPENVSEPLLNH